MALGLTGTGRETVAAGFQCVQHVAAIGASVSNTSQNRSLPLEKIDSLLSKSYNCSRLFSFASPISTGYMSVRAVRQWGCKRAVEQKVSDHGTLCCQEQN
jgi:hypothetical protein